ncbi:MAG: phage tail tube protein [bacterium]
MYTRRAVVLSKIESNYGVDPTPVPASNAVLTSVPDIKFIAEKHERDFVRQTLSPMSHVVGARNVEISFDVELKGSGAAGTPPPFGPLLRACGLAETIEAGVSVAYSPASASFESCTIYYHKHNLLNKVIGCRGTVDLELVCGKYGVLKFAMKGIYASPIDTNIPSSVTYNSTLPPVVLGATLTIGGYTPVATKVELGLKNEVVVRQDITQSTGVASIEIIGRKPAGSIDPEAVTIATKDFWSEWLAGTLQALNCMVGDTAGNIVTIAAPKCQYTDVGYSDKGGTVALSIPFDLKANAGDDELSITFT